MKLNIKNMRGFLCFIHGENALEIQRLVKTIFCETNHFGKKHKNNITTQLYFHFICCLLFNFQSSVFLQ